MGRGEDEFLKSSTIKVLKMIEISNNLNKPKGNTNRPIKQVSSMRDFL